MVGGMRLRLGRASDKALKQKRLSDATRCIHAGEERHGKKAPLTTPIAQTSVFILPEFEELRRYAEGKSDAYLYTRYGNPTTAVAERKLAALEGAGDPDIGCVVTASGQTACLITVLACCEAGDEVVSMLDIYGGTLKLFENVLPRFGIRVRLVPYEELGRLDDFFNRHTRLLFLETPANPTLRCVDLAALAAVAKRRKVPVAVDNTFATPILQKPLHLGADIVIHSATKYLGGHSDLTAGAIVAARPWIDSARNMKILSGGLLDPLASYFLIRGLKTLQLRVERACLNTHTIVEALRGHAKLERVLYPGLQQNQGYEAARSQMRDFGMMLSIDLKGGERSARKFIDALELWYLAASLGGVESTVSYPLLSSHVGFDRKRLKLMDVTSGLVRLSVGIESADDLIADLEHALARA